MSGRIATKCVSVKRESGENPEQIRCCVLRKESADNNPNTKPLCRVPMREGSPPKRSKPEDLPRFIRTVSMLCVVSHCSYECAKVSGQHGSDVSEAFGK